MLCTEFLGYEQPQGVCAPRVQVVRCRFFWGPVATTNSWEEEEEEEEKFGFRV